MTDTATTRAIATLIVALNGRPDPERIGAFVGAIDELGLCRACVPAAARKLAAYLARRPVPNDLALEIRDQMTGDDHAAHAVRALPAGDGVVWWQREGRAAVTAAWPDCPNPGWVADQIRRLGYLPPDPGLIAVEVGAPGTREREWWVRHAERSMGVPS